MSQKVKTAIFLEADQAKKLREIAYHVGIPASHVIRNAINYYLDESEFGKMTAKALKSVKGK